MNVPAKATHRQTRQYHRRLVLRTLYDYAPVSRATGSTASPPSDPRSPPSSPGRWRLWDEARNLPLRIGPEERILAIMPRPVDLTPADTPRRSRRPRRRASRRPPACGRLVVGYAPDGAEIADARRCAMDAAAVVVGTIAAEPGSPRRTSSTRCSRLAGRRHRTLRTRGTCWRTRTRGPICARIRSCRIRSRRSRRPWSDVSSRRAGCLSR